MRGRKPLPTATKEASGAFEKDPQRRNDSEPIAKRGFPDVPVSIAGDELAVECWNRICGTLDDMGILTVSDFSVLEVYCQTYSQWRFLNDYVKNGNVREVSSKGDARTSPEAVQVHKYADRLVKLMAELGLTPSSRSRIHAPGKEEEDPFAEFLKKRMGRG